MREHFNKRLRSERGATISFALLIFFVCAAISAIVLAAATAAAGAYAGLGSMDQGYYSVNSAAQLFLDSLNKDGSSATYIVTETRTGTAEVPRLSDKEPEPSNYTPYTATCKTLGSTGKGYPFLSALTRYAFANQQTESDAAFTVSGEGEPLAFLPNDNSYKSKTFTLTPSLNNAGLPADALKVEVKAKLSKNWVLELEFSNATDARGDSVPETYPADRPIRVTDVKRYYTYVVLVADVVKNDSRTNRVINSEAKEDPNDSSKFEFYDTVKVTQQKTYEITWHLRQIVPGRGLS